MNNLKKNKKVTNYAWQHGPAFFNISRIPRKIQMFLNTALRVKLFNLVGAIPTLPGFIIASLKRTKEQTKTCVIHIVLKPLSFLPLVDFPKSFTLLQVLMPAFRLVLLWKYNYLACGCLLWLTFSWCPVLLSGCWDNLNLFPFCETKCTRLSCFPETVM